MKISFFLLKNGSDILFFIGDTVLASINTSSRRYASVDSKCYQLQLKRNYMYVYIYKDMNVVKTDEREREREREMW